MVSELRRRFITAKFTLRNPYMARMVFIIDEISFAQNVHVSLGYRLAPDRSSLMYGRKRLSEWSASVSPPYTTGCNSL